MTWEKFRNIYNKEPSDFELQLATTIEQHESKEKELVEYKERLQAVFDNRWSVSYDSRIMRWIVQRCDQTVENLGDGSTPQSAIDAARKERE